MVKNIFNTQYTINSETGEVINTFNGRVMSLSKNSQGYIHLGLTINGKYLKFKHHRIIAIHFIPNPENKEQVNHIDGVKHNNKLENLEWCTRSENALHAFRINLQSNVGAKNPRTKLIDGEVLEIRKLFEEKATVKKLSEQFNVSKDIIWAVVKRKTWKHI